MEKIVKLSDRKECFIKMHSPNKVEMVVRNCEMELDQRCQSFMSFTELNNLRLSLDSIYKECHEQLLKGDNPDQVRMSFL